MGFLLMNGGLNADGRGWEYVVKIWKQDEDATPESHPLDWKPALARQKF